MVRFLRMLAAGDRSRPESGFDHEPMTSRACSAIDRVWGMGQGAAFHARFTRPSRVSRGMEVTGDEATDQGNHQGRETMAGPLKSVVALGGSSDRRAGRIHEERVDVAESIQVDAGQALSRGLALD